MFSIIKTDLRNIARDPSLLIIFFVPVIMISLLHFGYPFLAGAWPEAVNYIPYGFALLCMIVAIMPGMAIAFVILDEKDNNVQDVLQILPVSFKLLTLMRMACIFLFGWIAAAMLLLLSGIETGNVFQIVCLSALSAMSAPIMAMVPAFFARNKIEGATITKLLTFLIILPLPAFLFPGIWKWFLVVFPAWWVFAAFENREFSSQFLFLIIVGISYQTLLFLGFSVWVFSRKQI